MTYVMHNYKKLDVWDKGIDLAESVYKATKTFTKEKKFGIISQMRRCAVSISSNIAFGSCAELETQLIISKRLGYLTSQDFNEISPNVIEIQ